MSFAPVTSRLALLSAGSVISASSSSSRPCILIGIPLIVFVLVSSADVVSSESSSPLAEEDCSESALSFPF